MPFSTTRDLWLVLKARDETNRALRSFSTNIRDVGRQVEIAQALSNKADAQRTLNTLKNKDKLLMAEQAAAGMDLAEVDRIKKLRVANQGNIEDTKKLIDQYDQQARALKVLDMKQEEHRRKTLMLGQQLQGVAAASAAVGLALTAGGIAGVMAIKKLVDVSVEYNRTVALTKTQVDGFQASLQDLSKEGLDVANNIAVPFEQIQSTLFDIFSSTTANLKQSKVLLDAFAKTAVAGQVSLQDASRGTMAIMNAFHIPFERVNNVLDVEFQLVRKGVGTYEEFSKIIGRVAPSANRAGQSLETMSAMLAFLTRNGLSAAMASASAGRALDAFSNPAAVKNLEGIGIQMKNAKGEFRDLSDILTQLSHKFAGLTGPERSKAISDIFKGAGGTIQARRFIDQVLKPGEVDRFKGFLKDMQNASGQFGNAYTTMSNTTAAKTQLLSNRWQVLKVTAGNILTPVLLNIISALNGILNWFNKLNPSTQKTIVMFLGLGAVFSVFAGLLLFVVSGLAALAAAVAVAGSAVFVTIGAVVGLTVGLAGLVAMIVMAWRKSSDFRATIIDIVTHLREWYTTLSAAIMPILDKIGKLLMRTVVPAIKEVAGLIKTGLHKAFMFIGLIINNVVIPAFTWLNKFYEKHRATINSILPYLKQFVKLMLMGLIPAIGIVIAAIAGLIIATGLIIAAFAAITIAIIKVVEWIGLLVKWFKKEIPAALSATKSFFVGIWNDIAGFFVGIWRDITGAVSSAWDFIVSIFDTVMGRIKQSWENFWGSSIGRFLKATIDFIVAVVQLGIALIEFVILWTLRGIQIAWEATWGIVRDGAVTVWNWIYGKLKAIWTAIFDAAVFIWSWIVNSLSKVWHGFLIIAGVIFELIKAKILSVWNSIKGPIISIMTSIVDGVKFWWGKITGFFSGAGTTIGSYFKDAGKWLFNAGKNIVQGLIDGLTSMVDKVTQKIKDITKSIRDHFPFSPAKVGPLSGRGSPFYAGQNIAKMLASGMQSQVGLIGQTAAMMTNAINVNGSGTNYVGSTFDAASGASKTVNQTFNITTQEINPRRHSAELGFALAGRL